VGLARYSLQGHTKAAKWYRLAAVQGDAGGQLMLSLMYLFGHGLEKDPIRAHMWASLSIANGDQNNKGLSNRDIAESWMTPSQI
jgi:uncharacterized protein